jgi:2,4-dienoyl-CoA reductase (NADPH2)
MSAALSAFQHGHAVTLYEKTGRLGGQLHLASAPPGREEFLELARDLEKQLHLTDITVKLNAAADAQTIAAKHPDAVILATGAGPVTLPIPGIDRSNVVQAWDVLQDRALVGKTVAIIGGGAVGVETALFIADKGTLSGETLKFLLVNRAESPETLYELATRGTRDVTLVEMLDKIGKDIGKSTRWGMLQDLSRIGVKTTTATKALEITPTGLKVERDGKIIKIPADTIVVAAGSCSLNPLEEPLSAMGIPCQVVGDARKVALAFDAVHQGYNAGRGPALLSPDCKSVDT